MTKPNLNLNLLKIGVGVMVDFEDASSHDEGWATIEELQNHTQSCTTVGFVVRKDRKQVLLAMNRGGHPSEPSLLQYATTMAIPLGWITAVKVLS